MISVGWLLLCVAAALLLGACLGNYLGEWRFACRFVRLVTEKDPDLLRHLWQMGLWAQYREDGPKKEA